MIFQNIAGLHGDEEILYWHSVGLAYQKLALKLVPPARAVSSVVFWKNWGLLRYLFTLDGIL